MEIKSEESLSKTIWKDIIMGWEWSATLSSNRRRNEQCPCFWKTVLYETRVPERKEMFMLLGINKMMNGKGEQLKNAL